MRLVLTLSHTRVYISTLASGAYAAARSWS